MLYGNFKTNFKLATLSSKFGERDLDKSTQCSSYMQADAQNSCFSQRSNKMLCPVEDKIA